MCEGGLVELKPYVFLSALPDNIAGIAERERLIETEAGVFSNLLVAARH